MNRRSVLRNLAMLSAGIALLPSCGSQETAATLKPDHFTLTGDEEKTLAALTDFLIPQSSTPGAKDMDAHVFAVNMVDDCYSKEERDRFITGFRSFTGYTQKKYSRSFPALTADQKSTFLQSLESKKEVPEEALSFYQSMKRLTIQSYTSSKYYMLEVAKYEMVPGRYHGCVPVKAGA